MQYGGSTLRDVECLVRTPQWRSQHFCLLVLTDYYNSDQSTCHPGVLYCETIDVAVKESQVRRFITTTPQRNSLSKRSSSIHQLPLFELAHHHTAIGVGHRAVPRQEAVHPSPLLGSAVRKAQ
jgi:hypothetical protein